MKRIVLMFVFGLLALLSVMTVTPTSAQEPPIETQGGRVLVDMLVQAGDAADEVFASFTATEKRSVMEQLKVAEIRSTPVPTLPTEGPLATQGCSTAGHEVSGYSAIGLRLWTYRQNVSWCYDGNMITNQPQRMLQVDIPNWAPTWRFEGEKSNSITGGQGQWSYSAYTMGHFKNCYTDIGCVQNKFPWIKVFVYGAGSWYTEGGL